MRVAQELSAYGDAERAKALLLAICFQNPGGWKQTILNKIFWRAHLLHMRESGIALSDWPIVHGPFGPKVESTDELLAELVSERAVTQRTERVLDFTATLTSVADDRRAAEVWGALGAAAQAAIAQACDEFQGKGSIQASHDSHKQSVAWRETPNSAEMPVYADLVSPDEAEQMRRAAREFLNISGTN